MSATTQAKNRAIRAIPAQLIFPAGTNALKLLSHLAPMGKKPEARKAEVHEHKNLPLLYDAFQELLSTDPASDRIEKNYAASQKLINEIDISQEDLDAFIGLIPSCITSKEENYRAGLFLSALINASTRSFFTLNLTTLGPEREPDWLGYKNTKHILVNGNVGRYAGDKMRGDASLIINGNAGDEAGVRMRGTSSLTILGNAGFHAASYMNDNARAVIFGSAGRCAGMALQDNASATIFGSTGDQAGIHMSDKSSLTILGNTGDYAGAKMLDGARIIIFGSAGKYAGHGMYNNFGTPSLTIHGSAGANAGLELSGGDLCIGGEIESLGWGIKGGNIFHKGKQIIKDGKLVE